LPAFIFILRQSKKMFLGIRMADFLIYLRQFFRKTV